VTYTHEKKWFIFMSNDSIELLVITSVFQAGAVFRQIMWLAILGRSVFLVLFCR